MEMTTTRRRLIGVVLASAVAAITGCRSSKTESPASGAGAAVTTAPLPTAPASVSTNFPVTVNAANGPVTVKALPTAIVSLSPTATEMLFAIGAGKQVAAVDDQSTYPAQAPRTDLSGFKPNVEAIAARKPDLVVISDDSAKLTDSLGKLGITVLLQPPAKTFDDVYAQIGELGKAVGKGPEAKGVADTMRSTITEVVNQAPKKAVKIYHEVDTTLYAASSSSFIGQVYKAFGLTNIADAADKDASGYPQLSNEYIVAANPELIFLADTNYAKQDAATVAARAGWAGIDAVKNKRIVNLDDDIASRWSPRLVLLVQAVGAALAKG
jgi:iron complex transport system substrate-binding protein